MNGKLTRGGIIGGIARGRTSFLKAFEARVFQTTGGGAVPTYFPVTEAFEVNGALEALQIHALCTQRSANFKYRFRIGYSFDNVVWLWGSDVLGEQTALGYVIGSWFTTATEFGRYIRLEIGLADTGAVEEGTLYLSAALKSWGQ